MEVLAWRLGVRSRDSGGVLGDWSGIPGCSSVRHAGTAALQDHRTPETGAGGLRLEVRCGNKHRQAFGFAPFDCAQGRRGRSATTTSERKACARLPLCHSEYRNVAEAVACSSRFFLVPELPVRLHRRAGLRGDRANCRRGTFATANWPDLLVRSW